VTSRDTRAAIVLGLGLLVSYAYFYAAGGWNQNSRFALVRAIIERHTLTIDAYQLHTGDRAIWKGHYYSDKAPGTSLTAVVPVAIARVVSRAAGVDPEGFPGIAWTSYVAAVSTSAVFTVIAALCVFWLSRRWGASRGAAIFAATAYGVASPAWAYGTLFVGHGPTAGCLMIAFLAAEAIASANGRSRGWLALAIGLSGGWAVVTEYQAAVPAIFIGVLVVERLRRDQWRGARECLAPLAAGVAIAAAPLLAYNALAFDSPFRIGYASEEGFKEMQTGLFGITYPKPSIVRELLFGSYRGLLPLAPLMAAAPFGLARLAGRRHTGPALVAGGIVLYYLLLNASYYFWEGGWFYGPRQLTPGLPFLALGLAPLWDRGRQLWRSVLVAGWICGATVTLVAVSTTPQPPSSFKSPVRELLWPAFRDGDLSLNHQTFVHGGADPDRLRGGSLPHAAWNLGELAGLRGLPSLLPLGLVWVLAGGVLRL
jgi:hypothetical protein